MAESLCLLVYVRYVFLKISASDVCGCPLVTNVFEETGDFCRASKRRCLKHYCWEKLRRAEIDLQRIQQVEMCSIYGSGVGWELVARGRFVLFCLVGELVRFERYPLVILYPLVSAFHPHEAI